MFVLATAPPNDTVLWAERDQVCHLLDNRLAALLQLLQAKAAKAMSCATKCQFCYMMA